MSDIQDDTAGRDERRDEGLDRIAAEHLPQLLERVRDAFAHHRDEIDELNVFPVPDGDTGTNLLLTVRAALAEAVDEPGSRPTPRALARAAVMSARGNSGVILSQVLRGLFETIEENGPLDADGIGIALKRAEERAYGAVADPVEGTMLTAVRVAAEKAQEIVARTRELGDLGELSSQVLEAVRAAVRRTPEQLDVLREAGVVDAGARGFEVFWEALHHLVTGAPPPRPAPPSVHHEHRHTPPCDDGSLGHGYEVQYLLAADEEHAPELRRRLEDIGDSVVVSGDGDILNVHVHTDDIGAAIEAGVELGRPSRIEVTSFAEQIAARTRTDESADDSPTPELGCVAVLPGPGLRTLAEEHGVVAAAGAAGDLPSVAVLLEGIGRAQGERVLVLPGHPNIVPTAHQAAEVSVAEGGREIVVLDEADAPPRVLAALAVWDREGEVGAVLEAMRDAAAAGTVIEVVAAVRDAQTPLGPVREGQYLGLIEGEVVAIDDDPVRALVSAIGRGDGDVELVTLIVGDDVDEDERGACEDAIASVLPEVEVEIVRGGQRPARYHIGLE